MNTKPPHSEDRSANGSSYGQILRSTSIIGGAQGINFLIGMVRTKLVAILLGPSGVGLVGLYMSATGLVGKIAGLGISSSGVREISEAHTSGDPERMARTLKTLRRACWATGIFGWVLTAALSYPLSQWTFNSHEYAWPIALLGITLLFGSITGGEAALVQGTRRIGDLARLNVLGVLAGTIIAVGLYWWLGKKGIVPVLIVTSAINLGIAWWFARKIQVTPIFLSFSETWKNSKRLVGLGMAFMWSSLLAAAVALAIRVMIVDNLGLEANGIYQAAWGISGMFAGFILGAMGTEFYPRLAAASNDHVAMSRIVNEQIEIGMLLALPGLVVTLFFAPWLMTIFYTTKFLPGAELLPWFVIGVFLQVLVWPMGYITIALGAGKWFAGSETATLLLQILLSILLLKHFGLCGVALAFSLYYLFYMILALAVSFHLIKFRWSNQVVKILLGATFLVGASFAAHLNIPEWGRPASGVLFSISSIIYSLRGLVSRLGQQHRLVLMACRMPYGRLLCGICDKPSQGW